MNENEKKNTMTSEEYFRYWNKELFRLRIFLLKKIPAYQPRICP